MKRGAFCLVLHTHLPYVRSHGAWPCGEDWFHQAAVDAYLPLARVFRRLEEAGFQDIATVSVSPILATQMSDPYMLGELHLFLGRLLLRAERQVANYRGPHQQGVRDLAGWYYQRYASILEEFERRWRRGGLHLAFREAADAGVVELMTSFAGHPFVPLLRDEGLAAGQLETGLAEHERLFGHRPSGAWLPECGYRPGEAGRLGTEMMLEKAGIGYTVVDAPTVREAGLSVRRPVEVSGSSVRFLARDMETSYLVWSPSGGYPGGSWYRDSYHYDAEAGFRSFRVTDRSSHVADKEVYESEPARRAAAVDAGQFAHEVEERLETYARENGRPGLVLACFDTELFGHWWFEGPEFLEALFHRFAEGGRVEVLTISQALERFPSQHTDALPLSSWGRGKDTSAWLSPSTEPIWSLVWDGEQIVRSALDTGVDQTRLRQAIRELVLLSASDWPFMIARGRAADYARERAEGHHGALRALLSNADETLLARLQERDNPFPTLREEDFR
ncbi:MAG: 1,4-alpha-glucan branching protein domain-containing protein [Actinomycetota bacterium]